MKAIIGNLDLMSHILYQDINLLVESAKAHTDIALVLDALSLGVLGPVSQGQMVSSRLRIETICSQDLRTSGVKPFLEFCEDPFRTGMPVIEFSY